MNTRPGGISDDDAYSDEEFSFPDEQISRNCRQLQSHLESKAESHCKQDNTAFSNIVDNTYDSEHSLQSALIKACMTGQISVIEECLESHGINDFLYTGWTPMLYAASHVQVEVLDYLLKHGADPNKHRDGYTPLMALCNSVKGDLERALHSLKLLLEAKANLNAVNKLRETPLMFACKTREPEFVQELLKHVKCIDNCDSEGRTALIYAVIANNPAVVKILVENGASTTITERNNMTARDIAELKGYQQILSILNLNEEDEFLELLEPSNSYPSDWRDMFPSLKDENDNTISYDVIAILYGMGLEKYSTVFQGINLKTFLHLTEEDLLHLGMDISVHRKQFMEYLYKFHIKKWNTKSIGIIDKSLPYTTYDGIVSLGITAKQIAIIGSSFKYIKSNIQQGTNLTIEQRKDYEKQLNTTENTLKILKRELLQVKDLAEKINRQTTLEAPACYIEPKKKKTNWTIIFGISLIITAYLLRTQNVQRMWH